MDLPQRSPVHNLESKVKGLEKGKKKKEGGSSLMGKSTDMQSNTQKTRGYFGKKKK